MKSPKRYFDGLVEAATVTVAHDVCQGFVNCANNRSAVSGAKTDRLCNALHGSSDDVKGFRIAEQLNFQQQIATQFRSPGATTVVCHNESQSDSTRQYSRCGRIDRSNIASHDDPRPVDFSSGQLVEKEIDSGNPLVSGNEEVRSSVSRRFAGAARYLFDACRIAQFLGLGNWLMSKVRVSSLDRARDAIDRVTATVAAAVGIVKHAIFGQYLVDGCAAPRGIVFTEDVAKIPDQ
jgi:hypothetical protein